MLRRALANTRPARLSHSLDTQCPAASHHPDSLQSQCAHSRERFLQLGPGFWEGGPEVAGVGGGVVHICFREKLLPRNWPWAKQQVVHFGVRQERGLESRSGAMTFPSLPTPAPAPQARQERGAPTKPGVLPHTRSHHFVSGLGTPPRGWEEPDSQSPRPPQASSGGGGERAWAREGPAQLLPPPAPPSAVGSRRNSNWGTAAAQSSLSLFVWRG